MNSNKLNKLNKLILVILIIILAFSLIGCKFNSNLLTTTGNYTKMPEIIKTNSTIIPTNTVIITKMPEVINNNSGILPKITNTPKNYCIIINLDSGITKVNIRELPDEKSRIIKVALEDERYEIISKTDLWIEVETGWWIYSKYCEVK